MQVNTVYPFVSSLLCKPIIKLENNERFEIFKQTFTYRQIACYRRGNDVQIRTFAQKLLTSKKWRQLYLKRLL